LRATEIGSMNLLRLAPTLAACLLSLPAAAQAPIRLHVDIDERANAIFHLACLAETILCTKSVFDRFWEEEMVFTDEDRAALETWRNTMSNVTWNALRPVNEPLVPNATSFHAGEAAREAVIVAAMDSATETDLVKKSGRAIRTVDAKRLLPAIEHFQRRLGPWLESAADATFRARADEAEALAERSGFAETMTQMMKFLESDLDGSDVYLHVIVPPDPDAEHSIATVLRRHLVVEAVDADAGSLVSVAVHELTHHLFDRAPKERHRALIDEFVSSGLPAAVGLYTYLNEAVAIGAQALHAARQGDGADYWSEHDAYDHPYIAPLGGAAGPLVIDAVARGDTLFDGFVPGYIEAGTIALLTQLREPKFVLAQVVLLEPRDGDAIMAAFLAKLSPHASARFFDVLGSNSYPNAPLVRCVRYEQLRPLTRQIPELASLTGSRGFAYAIKRGPIASTYVLAGRETNDVIDVVTKLSELPSLSAEGLLFTLE
jgi:hypothetical protein